MHIVFALPAYHFNLDSALRALQARGHKVSILIPDEDSLGRLTQINLESIKVIRLKLKQQMFFELYQRLSDEAPDAVIIRRTPRLSKDLLLAAAFLRIPCFGYHQRPASQIPRSYFRLRQFLRREPVRSFTPVKGLSKAPTVHNPWDTYIPFPVAPGPVRLESSYAPNGVVRILCVAKLAERRKNISLLISVLEKLAPERKFHLTISGASSLKIGNPDPELLDWTRRYPAEGKIGNRVTILEDVPYSEMTNLYRSHDLFVLPSRNEPCSVSPVEAMAQSLPAVVADDNGIAGVFSDAQSVGMPCGAIFETNNSSSLLTVIRDLISEPGKLAQLGKNGHDWSRHELSGGRFVERFEALINHSSNI